MAAAATREDSKCDVDTLQSHINDFEEYFRDTHPMFKRMLAQKVLVTLSEIKAGERIDLRLWKFRKENRFDIDDACDGFGEPSDFGRLWDALYETFLRDNEEKILTADQKNQLKFNSVIIDDEIYALQFYISSFQEYCFNGVHPEERRTLAQDVVNFIHNMSTGETIGAQVASFKSLNQTRINEAWLARSEFGKLFKDYKDSWLGSWLARSEFGNLWDSFIHFWHPKASKVLTAKMKDDLTFSPAIIVGHAGASPSATLQGVVTSGAASASAPTTPFSGVISASNQPDRVLGN